MRPFPWLDLALREEREAVRRALAVERQVVMASGGCGSGPRRPADLAAQARASRAFGFRGGELCGCHRPGCETCAANGGCGDSGCRRCQGRLADLWAATRSLGGARPVFPYRLRRRRTKKARLPGRNFGFVDMHAHNMCASNLDFADYLAGVGATETEARIDRLLRFRDEADADEVVVMGSYDGEVSGGMRKTIDINEVTEAVWAADSAFFAPFYHVRTEEMDEAYVLTDATTRIETDGWCGIGELFVHGHGYNYSYTGTGSGLYALCAMAANNLVPVSVHWEFGLTDDIETWPPETNFEELLALLDDVKSNTGADLKLIVCHVGVGPANAADETDIWARRDLFQAWKVRIDHLLANYSELRFDLAGMQLGIGSYERGNLYRLVDASLAYTPLGLVILDWLRDYPDRFLIGTDCDNGEDVDTSSRWGVETYLDSVDLYHQFLGPLFGEIAEQVFETNAFDVLTRS